MKHVIPYALLCALFFFFTSCESNEITMDDISCEEQIDLVSFNNIQVIGSHNSYRKKPNAAILQLIAASADQLPPDFDPESWDYDHISLDEQFDDYNIRSVELDVYRDPSGGLFYARKGNELVGLDPDSKEDELLEPGLKVMHFPDFDYLSHHLTFKASLENIKAWSEMHPRHLPITILVETKEDSPDLLLPGLGLTSTLPFDQNSVEEIESEINEVFAGSLDHIFTPDELRGSQSTLNQAVKRGNWPELSQMRGRIIFVLMGREGIIDDYINGHSSLSGRNMFVFTDADTPESAFLKMDDPVANIDIIQERIREGYIVRTRADADTEEARTGDETRLIAAINSGAQIISTDYYKADARALQEMGWTDYEAHFNNDELAILNNADVIDAGGCVIVE